MKSKLIVSIILLLGATLCFLLAVAYAQFSDLLEIAGSISGLAGLLLTMISYFSGMKKPSIIYLESLGNLLGKGDKEIKVDLFRKQYPLWIDFQTGYFVQRSEVDAISARLKDPEGVPSYMILGDAATGKSTIAMNIGYNLANEGWNVYVFDAGRFDSISPERVIEEIRILSSRPSTLIVVENVHLNPRESEQLLVAIRGLKPNTHHRLLGRKPILRLLFTARPIYEQQFSRKERISLLEEKYCWNVIISSKTEDIADKIIDLYIGLKNLKELNAEERRNLVNQSGGNLWILKYLLKGWKPGEPVDKEEVLMEVTDDLKEIATQCGSQSLQILMTVATFYEFEIPVEQNFLISDLRLDRLALEKLVLRGELKLERSRRNTQLIGLHHSALADLYLKTLQGRGRALSIQPFTSEQMTDMFRKYVISKPFNYSTVIMNTPNSLMVDTLDDDATVRAVTELLEGDEEVARIGVCLERIERGHGIVMRRDLLRGTRIAGRIIKALNPHSLEAKIEKESNASNIGICMESIAIADKQFAQELANSLNIENLRTKLEKESQLSNIGSCIHEIGACSYGVATKLLDIAANRLKAENDLFNIRQCLEAVTWGGNKDLGAELLKLVGAQTLQAKIEGETDISKIGFAMGEIARIDPDLAMELLDALKVKLENEQNLRKVRNCLDPIRYGNANLARTLVESLNTTNLEAELDREEDIAAMGSCLRSIASASSKVGKRVIQSLQTGNLISRLEEEQDLVKIQWCLEGLSEADRDIGGKLVRSLGIENLMSKFQKEEDASKVGFCFETIAKLDKQVALKLLDTVRSKLDEKNIMLYFTVDGISMSFEDFASRL